MSKTNEDIVADNDRSLKTLLRAIELSQLRFSLILVRCNYESLREQVLKEVQERSSVPICSLTLPESAQTLYSTIQAQLGSKSLTALMVLGLESVAALDELLTSTNRVRDEFRKTFSFPLVLWANDEILQKLINLAPDFYSWAGIPIHFVSPTADLIELLEREADELFTKVLEAGAERFIDNATLNLGMGAGKRFELSVALHELSSRGVSKPELAASQQFILGRDAYARNQMEQARELFDRSLAVWQQNHNLKRQACLLFHLGLWWRKYATRHRAEYEAACERARDYYQQCVEILQQANRPDLAAKFINAWGAVLQQLEQWDELEKVANTALELHQIYPHPIGLGKVYGYLAEVASARSWWMEAKQYAETALEINDRSLASVAALTPNPSPTPPGLGKGGLGRGKKSQLTDGLRVESGVKDDRYPDTYWGWAQQLNRSWYRLLLARSQRHLGQRPQALQNLAAAKVECQHKYNPRLYLRILEALRSLYFEEHQYLKAFYLKQEKSSIEQQYGFRAFIGAGLLQSERQVIHPAFVSTVTEAETIAQEIISSGRKPDVDRLIDRLSRDDCKLTVIHGQSGVGKTSLLTGGLVPALHQIGSINGRNPLPVVASVYTDWVGELGDRLGEALVQMPNFASLPITLDSVEAIVAQLRNNVNCNLLTVLIFDQFGQFFFNYPNPVDRRSFWEFLHVCLNSFDLPYINVILSLREDYLHYLLECDRLVNVEITQNDILNQSNRYYFGNFSPEQAKRVIQSLTERSSQLDPLLIDEFVRDLAEETGEIRPIELQVVGTQLETEKITTLAEYQERGLKRKLVERFLDAVVKDCGPENERAAQLVLYLLTDENNIRPAKTKTELADKLESEADKLDLVLEILLKSGLVFLLPQCPTNRYQLVHAYLISFIRQQQGAELLKELQELKKQKNLAESSLDRILKMRRRDAVAGILLAILAVLVGGFWMRSSIRGTNAELVNLITKSELRFAANNQLDSFVESLRAGIELKRTIWEPLIKLNTKTQVIGSLQRTVYGVRERNRFQHDAAVNSVSFGQGILASIKSDGTIVIWKLDGTQITFTGTNKALNSINLSSDSKTLVAASSNGTIFFWSFDGKELILKAEIQLQNFTDNSDRVSSVSFSNDLKKIAFASKNGTIELWSLETGQALKTIKTSKEMLTAISFSPDGNKLAVGSNERTIELWNLETDKEFKTFTGHNEAVTSISFSRDGKTLASASRDGIIQLSNVEDGGEIQSFLGHTARINSISFSPDGKTIASASRDGIVKLWSLETSTFQGHSSWINSVSFSPDGMTIASASDDTTVKLWSLDGKVLKTFKGHNAEVTSVSFSPDDKMIASASGDRTVKLWNLNGKLRATLLHSNWVNSVGFSPDGQTIASADDDKTIKLWNIDGQLLKTITGHNAEVTSISFSPDGKILASASRDGTVKLWSFKDGQELRSFTGKAVIISVSFSPDGKAIAAASADSTVKLWSLDGKLLEIFRGHKYWVNSVSFSKDSKILASASADNTVKLWNLEDGRLLGTFQGHRDWVNSVSFSKDGKIASAGADKTVTIWNWQDQTLDGLLSRGCDWVRDYLKKKLNESDRHLCDGISTPSK